MGQCYRDGQQVCENCRAIPRELGMAHFSYVELDDGWKYYLCPRCRKGMQQPKRWYRVTKGDDTREVWTNAYMVKGWTQDGWDAEPCDAPNWAKEEQNALNVADDELVQLSLV